MAIIIVGASSRISESGFGVPNPPLTEEELRRSALRVGDGMRFLYWLSSHLFQEERWVAGIRRATRESWLMHASRLLAFYYGPRSVSRAVLAEDYVVNAEAWYEARPPAPGRSELGQYDVPSPAGLVAYGPDWPEEAVPRARRLPELTSGLVELSESFLGQLEEERLQWFGPSGEGSRAWGPDELNGSTTSGEEG